jgi:hypothetical protein
MRAFVEQYDRTGEAEGGRWGFSIKYALKNKAFDVSMFNLGTVSAFRPQSD